MKDKYEIIKIRGKNVFCSGNINPYVEACDKVVLQQTLKIPCNKKEITSITRIVIGVNINTIKVVSQPATNIATLDGSVVEIKKLLVAGVVLQRIFYKTNNCCKKIDFISVRIPFYKYIDINCNYIEGMDKYCARPIIRKVCARTLGKRCIGENIQLILSVHKTTDIPETAETSELANVITFYGENDLEVAEVKFDEANEKLIVTSTGNMANSDYSDEEYFKIILKNSLGEIKDQASVMGNETADNLANILNGASFENSDIIELGCMENYRVEISNYPNFNYGTYNPIENSEQYIITPDGLISYEDFHPMDLSMITVLAEDSNEVVKIEINNDNTIKVVSYGNIISQSTDEDNYFTMILKDNIGNIKIQASMTWNENGDNFATILNESLFEYNDILTLICADTEKVLIFNENGEEFNPQEFEESYVITTEGLQKMEDLIYYSEE